ncbi:MAG: type II toxin-antitoxin system VapC family toxin [Hyphomicrobiales bacterium]|nr:type II toxin-antitoxin system VapC family toxin [Hyphomicrobiales bacterium]
MELSIRHELTPYDAPYLAIAVERKLPLATCDKRLAQAAKREKVELLGPLAR